MQGEVPVVFCMHVCIYVCMYVSLYAYAYSGTQPLRKQRFLPSPSFLAAEHVLFGTNGHYVFVIDFQSKYKPEFLSATVS